MEFKPTASSARVGVGVGGVQCRKLSEEAFQGGGNDLGAEQGRGRSEDGPPHRALQSAALVGG